MITEHPALKPSRAEAPQKRSIRTTEIAVRIVGVSLAITGLGLGLLAAIPGAHLKAWADSMARDGDVETLTPTVLFYAKMALAACFVCCEGLAALLIRNRRTIASVLCESAGLFRPYAGSLSEPLIAFRNKVTPQRRRAVVVTAGLLLVVFSGIYFEIGLRLFRSGETAHYDGLFASDPPRVIRDMAKLGGDGGRSEVHPLFVLFVNPIGSRLAGLLHSTELAAIVLISVCAGLCVSVAFLTFTAFGMPWSTGVLFSLLLGFSTTHLVFGAQPDTFMLGALVVECAVLLTVCGASNLYLAAAGVAAFGITSTNLFPVALLGYVKAGTRTSVRMLSIVGLVIVAVLSASALLLVQSSLYPNTRSFLRAGSYGPGVFRYIANVTDSAGAANRLKEEFYSVLVYDFVAPTVYILEKQSYFDESMLPIGRFPCDRVCRASLLAAGKQAQINQHVPHLTFETPNPVPRFSRWGWAAIAIWGSLLVLALYRLISCCATRSSLAGALLAGIGFNLLLHFVYGDDLFLYSAHWTFLVTALACLGLRGLWRTRQLQVALVVLIVLMAINNTAFISNALSIFG